VVPAEGRVAFRGEEWHNGWKTGNPARKGRCRMSEFRNVTVVQKANVYFDGKVTSRTVIFPDGSKKTLGIMLPGEYSFHTGDKEIIEILAGDLEVQLPGSPAWQKIKAGAQFTAPANSKFNLKVAALTDYICSFVK
jgi:uncharacterized protein YaiE (UPF0345 family)